MTYLILRPRLKIVRNIQEEDLKTIREQEDQIARQDFEIRELLARKQEVQHELSQWDTHLAELKQSAQNAAEEVYDRSMELMQEKLATAAELERKKYQNTIEEYKKQLVQTMEEGTLEYQDTIALVSEQCAQLQVRYDELLVLTNAAIEASKRAEAIRQKENFYKLQLSNLDIEEIKLLRNVSPYLRDKEPLNKVIWKVYYEKPTSDLIGRVIGAGVHTGIYKITNLANNMCYVGQATNLADRWKQHIKRGLGADTPTRNKLYPAMMAFGVENFSFEVIEECSRDLLDAREDYWQDYFKAKEFGYSIK